MVSGKPYMEGRSKENSPGLTVLENGRGCVLVMVGTLTCTSMVILTTALPSTSTKSDTRVDRPGNTLMTCSAETIPSYLSCTPEPEQGSLEGTQKVSYGLITNTSLSTRETIGRVRGTWVLRLAYITPASL